MNDNVILIGLGSNLSFSNQSPRQILNSALKVLDRLYELSLISSFYESQAWPDPKDPKFLNLVVTAPLSFEPNAENVRHIMIGLHAIEAAFGRRRHYRNAPRSLDLDLLAVGDYHSDNGVILPHPGITERDFVLAPLAEILPDWVHPVTGQTAAVMLSALGQYGAQKVEKS